jgi:transcriptional regulator with XRE-family HTH domain
MMEFYNKLQMLRKQANLTQDELALKIGVSRQAISKWESGGAYPDLNNIQTLCAFFSVSADTLMNPKYEELIPEEARLEFNGNELGINIKRIRSAVGITQEAFAEQMKVSRQSVSKWENGSVVPKTEIIILMLDVLQAEFSELFPPVCVKENGLLQNEEINSESAESGATQPSRSEKKSVRIIIAVLSALLLLGAAAAVIIWCTLYGPFLKPYSFKDDFEEMFFEADKPGLLAD